MKNHEMMNYDYNEGTDFVGLMPKAAEMIGTIGDSDVSVHVHGKDAKGVDALEVVDVEKAFE
jgi:hypothetical protein